MSTGLPTFGHRIKRRVLAFAAALLLGLLAASLVVGAWLTRPVRSVVGAPPSGLDAQAVHIDHGAAQHLAGWYLPGRPGQGAVLLLHGVRGNRLQMLARARWLQQGGIASLLVDLPSHGESSGERIGFGRLEAPAVDAALAWLRERAPGERVGAIGVSLGGASLLPSGKVIFISRFLVQLRFLGPFIAGQSRVSWKKFLVWDILALSVYVSVLMWAGHYFEHRIDSIFDGINTAKNVLLVALAAGILWSVTKLVRTYFINTLKRQRETGEKGD